MANSTDRHPDASPHGITGLSFSRDMGHGRFGKDPRRQVQFLMVLALPDDIELPNLEQIVVTGKMTTDSIGAPVIQLHLHPSLIVDTLQPTQDELDFDEGAWAKKQREYIKADGMRIDQILTTLKWGC
jgi:hypothetical protein